jgi:YVTN family beta-propeller protein
MKRYTIIFFSLLITFFPHQSEQDSTDSLLVLNKEAHSAWQLDATTGAKIAEYPTGVAPHEVAISPNKKRAIITNYGDQHPGNSLTVIDLQNKKVNKTISLGKFTRPHGIKWFSDSKRAIVTVEDQQSVIVVDIDTGKILQSIRTNQKVSHMVSLDPAEATAYVTNLGSGSVSILDLEQGKRINTLQTGDGTEGIVVVPNNNEVWITNRSANTISVLDIETAAITDSFTSTDFPIRAELSNNEQWVAVSNAKSSQISIFDVESNKQIQKISTTEDQTSGMPIGLTFSNDDRYLYVSNSEQNNIAIINTGNWTLTDTFATDKTPDGIAYISANK